MHPLLIFFFLLLLISFLSKRIRLKILLSSIPGPQGIPLLGNALEFIWAGNDNFIKLIDKYNKAHGQRYKIMLGLQPYIIVWNAKDIEKLLSSQIHIDKSKDYDYLMPWLGTGLLTSAGQKWHNRRKLLTPAFHFKILDDFLTVINEQSGVLIDVLRGKVGEGSFNMFPIITHAALDIICETAMGKKIHAQLQSDSDYVRAIYRISELLQRRQVNPLLQPDLIWFLSPSGREEKRLLGILHGFTTSVINKRKKERKANKKGDKKSSSIKKDDEFTKPRLAFLDLLLDAQETSPEITDTDIREETDTFMFEGHDTTAASINWTLFLLGHNPQAQRKVQEELDSVLTDKDISSADLSKLKYLELCIKESLRLFPSVPFIARRINQEFVLDSNTKIPPSTQMIVMPHFTHRDPSVFPDPEAFIPERFTQEASQSRNPYAYIPFSAGPRNCIGQKFALMEEKVVLAQILRHFNIKSMEPLSGLTLLTELITRPKHGLSVQIKLRNKDE